MSATLLLNESRSVKSVDRKRILFQSILFDQIKTCFMPGIFFLMNVISFAGMEQLLKAKNILNFK